MEEDPILCKVETLRLIDLANTYSSEDRMNAFDEEYRKIEQIDSKEHFSISRLLSFVKNGQITLTGEECDKILRTFRSYRSDSCAFRVRMEMRDLQMPARQMIQGKFPEFHEDESSLLVQEDAFKGILQLYIDDWKEDTKCKMYLMYIMNRFFAKWGEETVYEDEEFQKIVERLLHLSNRIKAILMDD
jgi:hypothetical protein